MINDRIVEKVIAHCHEKWSLDAVVAASREMPFCFRQSRFSMKDALTPEGINCSTCATSAPSHSDNEVNCLDPGAD